MIQTRNYVTVDFQGKEIPSGHLRPFNLTANDGDIHQYAAVRADALNNMTDIIVSIAVIVGLKISIKPADKNHQYVP